MVSGPDVRFALLTPRGPGGIAVVEARGPGRLAAVARLLTRADGRALAGAELAGRGPLVARLCIDGARLDDVVVVDRPRRGVTELHVHGSEAVVAALERAVGLARDGDDADPAGRLLRHAATRAQLALALEQRACGPFDAFVDRLAAMPPARRRAERDAAIARSRVARALAEPFRCVLVGRQNAGKSTLLNRLLFADRALTGDLPGLTRDPVGAVTDLSGYPVELVDTAGEGPSDAEADRVALERGRRARAGAALVLVADGSRAFGDFEAATASRAALVVRSKADLPRAPGWPRPTAPLVEVSCVDASAAPAVRIAVGEALRRARALPVAPEDGVGGPAALDAAQAAALAAVGLR